MKEKQKQKKPSPSSHPKYYRKIVEKDLKSIPLYITYI
jgi:hypothetical protein